MIGICENKCWCEFCKRAIEKGEKYLVIFKSARKGVTRTNICKDCLMKISVEVGIKPKDISRIIKELIIDNLK